MADDINATAGEAADPMADFPRDAKPWLDAIKDAERVYQDYNDRCDSIDKLYANLAEMAKVKSDREFQIFWANLEVLKPSIYARPPVPVVVPRFKDQQELPRKASEVLERTLVTTFDLEDIDTTMRSVRDDLAINARGASWLRYEATQNEGGSLDERVCFDHVDRKDFLHEPARKWRETGWVAKRVWLSREEGLARFDDAFLKCEFKSQKDQGNDRDNYEGEKKAQVWEIWSKTKNAVVWVSPGVGDVLDVQPPFLSLEGFFPCPRPAYATLQRGSLIPVPDFLYYRDQVEEINELTARISALCESLRVKGFYASGAEDMTAAIETALKQQDNAAILVPVPTFALIAGQSMKDAIVWLPVVEIASVVRELIINRKQLIEDVYQITGISDIMRGDTNASETLGAQQLKSQYGSIRIRDRQAELVRIARDMTRMAAEIIAENFQPDTLMAMSQVDLPRQAVAPQQAQTPMQQPQMPPQGGDLGQPPQASPVPPQVPQKPPITMEDVVGLLRSQRVRPFVLDIETDSTIQADEDAEKQRRTEFITAIGSFMQTALPIAQQVPQSVPMITEFLKFTASGFRAGRELQGVIDQFAEEMKQQASQPKPQQPNPDIIKAQADAQRTQADIQHTQIKAQSDQAMAQANLQAKGIDLQVKQIELQIRQIEAKAKLAEATRAQSGETPVDEELTRAKINLTYAQAEQIRSTTLINPIKEAQAIDHAEREMVLAETTEPETEGVE